MKHLLKVDTIPTVDEFKSNTWEGRKPYVGLTIDKHEVFYNYVSATLPGGGASGYRLAKDSDFRWMTNTPWNGAWYYGGRSLKVGIPHAIRKGEFMPRERVVSYSHMFYNSTVNGVSSDNPYVTNMSYMFSGSIATSLELSKYTFDTSNVINMEGMFRNAQANTLDLTRFNTSNVENMAYMFYGSKATILDLSSFDTSKVTIMNDMFRDSEATVVYARTQEDINKFELSGHIPSTMQFIIKS